MAKARLYLFHGNDSRASSAELKRWLDLFIAKYGNATQYVLQADELSFEEIIQRFQQALETQSLFPEPRFVVVKRLSNTLQAARLREVMKVLGSKLGSLDDQVTVAFWEDKLLPTTHVMHAWFLEHTDKKQAEVKTHRVAQGRALVDGIVAKGKGEFTPGAQQWLEKHARRLEREQRITVKLRTGDEIASDWRVWVLANVVDSATLLAGSEPVTEEHLEKAAGVAHEAISPFEIVNAVQDGNWKQARKLVREWDQGDEGAYFGLVALLRNAFKRSGNQARASYALQLLGEIEILSKNVTVKQSWLLELFLTRCELFKRDEVALIDPRRAWLSHVQRVE
jgi:hypothetical protein